MHLLNYMRAALPNSGPHYQCGAQGPVPGLDSDQTAIQTSSQHDRALHNSETSMIIRKRRGLPQPTKGQQLSAIGHQLAKRTGVPEASLVVMCVNPVPPPKRRRTLSQKRNKKDVENVGGACYLCLYLKKKVPRLDTDHS